MEKDQQPEVEKQNQSGSTFSYEEEEYYSSMEDWITAYVSQKEFKGWFCMITEDFIDDDFNFYGLDEEVPHFEDALAILRNEDYSISDDFDDELHIEPLFLLAHARYIQSPDGLRELREKYINGVYGICPRVACEGQHVLPYGKSSKLGVSGCYVYCPRCNDIYNPTNRLMRRMDGAAFGPTIAALLVSDVGSHISVLPVKEEEKRIFGFKIHPSRQRLMRTQLDKYASASAGGEEEEDEVDTDSNCI